MAGMSLSTGLISGMDTGALVSQLMQIEANSQTLLKQRLSSTQTQATAYRAVNTRFDALRSAAEAVTKDTAWTPVKTSSSAASVSATATAGAATGSVTFTVNNVATAHSVVSANTWTATGTQTPADLPYGTGAIDVTVGGVTKSVTVGGTGSLADAVKAINADTSLKLSATAVKVSATEYRLQVTAKDTGEAARFTIGASITVTEPASNVTVKLADDPAAVASKISALVTSANGLLDAITSYTKAGTSTAALKGDATLRQLASQVLDTVSRLTGVDASGATAGLQLTRDGKFVFDQQKFTTALAADPALVRRIFTGTTTTAGADGIAGNTDDVTTATGIAGKLEALAKRASDSTTGMITTLATSKDSSAKDLENRIADWDVRLELRRASLTRQFTAMETALGTLQNQSQWLGAQLASLPSWSASSKS